MKTKFEVFLTEKGLTMAQFGEKSIEEMAELHGEFLEKGQEELKTALAENSKATTEQIAALEKSLTESQAIVLTTNTEAVKQIGLSVQKMMKHSNVSPSNSFKSQLDSFIADNADKIRAIKAAGSGMLEFKAVGIITTGNQSNPEGIPDLLGTQVAPPSNVNLRESVIDPLINQFPTSLPVYAYTDTLPKDGDFAFVAEGGIKPQIDFSMVTRYAKPVKIAAYEVLTEEAVTDIPGMQAIAFDYLRKKHNLKRQTGILAGDGIAPNPKGAFTYARAFTADDLAGTVENPNMMDVINAILTDIFTTHNYTDEMPYLANVVMMHPVDFFVQFVSAKDSFGHPLYPTATLFNRVVIGGVTIIPYEHVELPQGTIFVGDLSKYNVSNYVGYHVKIGWINDDFIKNQFVILGESRFHAFVKKLDEQAFVIDEIEVVRELIRKV